MESSRQIEERALAWLARKDSGRWSDAEQSEFADWLRADTAHRVAYLRLEVGWERSARLKAFGAGMTPGVVPPPGRWRLSPFFERRPSLAIRSAMKKASASKIAALAAGVLVLVGSGLYLRTAFSGDGYATPIGGIASISLDDGSRMMLNTASKVRVSLTQQERRIELQAGEAYFDVAKDPSRPFIVEAGRRRVIAVGTRFSVRWDGNEVEVVVTDGKVRVEATDSGASPELLAAGAVLHTARDSLLVQKKPVHEAEEVLSWRSGYLTFDETLLADAVAEFNRYTARQIVIDDPKLAALRINGKFRSNNADDFVQLLQSGYGIQVRRTGATVNLASN